MRASCVLKRQWMVAWAVLRWVSYAAMARPSASSLPWRARRQTRVMMLNSISAMFNQLACLGVW